MSYSSSCFTGILVLQEGIFYWMIHPTGGNLLYEDRFYWRICTRGSHVLHEGMSCRSVQKLQSFNSCEFRQLVCLFFPVTFCLLLHMFSNNLMFVMFFLGV